MKSSQNLQETLNKQVDHRKKN